MRRIASYPLNWFTPPIYPKDLTAEQVEHLERVVAERFVLACSRVLRQYGLIMDEFGAVWGPDGYDGPSITEAVNMVADVLEYDDVFDVATEWRANNVHDRG